MTSRIEPLLLSAADVAAAAPPLAEIVEIVADTYRSDAAGRTDIPAKVAVHPHGGQKFMHAMPAFVGGDAGQPDALGMKWVSYFPGNDARGVSDYSALVVLNDPETGHPTAIMEGMWITYARTAACAALAARLFANPAPRTLGLVGCGGLAPWTVRAVSAVLPSITDIRVASARAESRKAFCDRMAAEGAWRLTPVDSVREAVEGMDVVVSATPKLTVHPIHLSHWSPGTVIVPLDVTGAWDDDAYQGADRIACDHRGNLEVAFRRYRPNLAIRDDAIVSVQSVVTGNDPGRRGGDERILAFMTGVGTLDMTVAQAILTRAAGMGLGRRFALT